MSRSPWRLPAVVAVGPPGEVFDRSLVERMDLRLQERQKQAAVAGRTPVRSWFCWPARPGHHILALDVDTDTEPGQQDYDEALAGIGRALRDVDERRQVVVTPPLLGIDIEAEIAEAPLVFTARDGWRDSVYAGVPRLEEVPGGLAALVQSLLGPGGVAFGGKQPDNPSACDWCDATPSWRYRTSEPVALQATRPTATTTFGDWYACDACRPLVDAADWDALARRRGLPVPVPATMLNTWRAFGDRRHDAEPLTTGT
jgi:hypothetical protein